MNKLFPTLLLSLVLLVGCKKDSSILDDTFYLRHQGADMPVYVHGNAESNQFIVVIHGAGSFGLAFRNGAFTEQLEEHFAVVYWDQRGQGSSQGNYDTPEDILGLMASDIGALTTTLKAKYGEGIDLILMGHSLGGYLGLLSLIDQNLQLDANIKGWISVCGAHDFSLTRQARYDLIIEVAEAQIAKGQSEDAWTEVRNETLPLDPTNDEDYDQLLDLVKRCNDLIVADGLVSGDAPEGLLGNTVIQNNPLTFLVNQLFNQPVNEAVDGDFSLTDRLPELDIPSLWIYGQYDFSVPPIIGQQGSDAVVNENKRYSLFENSGHWPPHTEPEVFGEEVIDFLSGL